MSLHIQEVSPTDSGKRAVVISLFITFITFFCSFNLYLIRPGKKANLVEDLFNSIDAGSDMKVKKKEKEKERGLIACADATRTRVLLYPSMSLH